MRTAIESWLSGHWYGSNQPPLVLRSLEPVYRYFFSRSQLKRQSDAAAFRSTTPLLVIGNITAGGTGKTPLVIALCEWFAGMGLKTGVASTGYGRNSDDTLMVTANSDPAQCGDEAVLVARRTGVPVVVARKRVEAVRVLDEMHLDVLISDDGLQQADLARDIEFCVVDGARGLGNGHLIPAGPLRESAERLHTVNYVISNGDWPSCPDNLQVETMSMQVNGIHSLAGGQQLLVDTFKASHAENNIHAVTGIGNPSRFFALLESLGINASHHAFADHHPFKRGDFKSMGGQSVILMTEKDAVKCRSLGLSNAYFVGIDAVLSDDFKAGLKHDVMTLVKVGR